MMYDEDGIIPKYNYTSFDMEDMGIIAIANELL